jgi:hypothetical protein
MTNVDLARVEFAFVSANHFFVPITIGLAFLTALLQTAWYRIKRDDYLRLTRFFGAPLAMEGLAAFLLESTFVGLWLFGWDKLPRRLPVMPQIPGAAGPGNDPSADTLPALFAPATMGWNHDGGIPSSRLREGRPPAGRSTDRVPGPRFPGHKARAAPGWPGGAGPAAEVHRTGRQGRAGASDNDD